MEAGLEAEQRCIGGLFFCNVADYGMGQIIPLVLLCVVPLGFWDITENIRVQVLAALVLGGFIVVAWLYEFGHRGLDFRRSHALLRASIEY